MKGGTCAGGGRDGIGAQDPLRRPDGVGGGDGSDVVHYIGVVVAGNEAEADVRDAVGAGEAAAQGLTLVGSTATMRTSFVHALTVSPTPVMVPPLPTPMTMLSTMLEPSRATERTSAGPVTRR